MWRKCRITFEARQAMYFSGDPTKIPGHRSGIHNESCITKEEERTCESDERKKSSCRRDSHISYRGRRDPTKITGHILPSAIVIACMIREATAKDATELCVKGVATATESSTDSGGIVVLLVVAWLSGLVLGVFLMLVYQRGCLVHKDVKTRVRLVQQRTSPVFCEDKQSQAHTTYTFKNLHPRFTPQPAYSHE